MKLTDTTSSQCRNILMPYEGEITADSVKNLELCSKYGYPVSAMLADACGKEHTAVVVNLAADDKLAGITAYLLEHHAENMKAALKAIKEAVNAEDVFVLKTPEMSFDVEATVVETARSLVFREESALYHRLETEEVRSCPLEKNSVSEGYMHRPTVTVDAETLCRIYCGAKGKAMDSKLVAVLSGGESMLIEVKLGTPLSAIVEELGLKTEKNPLLGGLLGEFLSKDDLSKEVTSDAEFDLLVLYGNKDCLADVTLKLAEAAKEESCGKCVLCREGTWHVQNIFIDVTAGKAKKDDLEMILDICPLIHIGAFCSFGKKMANVFVSSVEKNRSELEIHFTKKKCPAGVCKAFAKMVIDPTKCTGCMDCIDECPEAAITGKKKFIHMIDPDMCENCGKCAEVCEEGAIVPQDGTIQVPRKLTKVGKF